jgi:hypothetical protein
LCADASGDSLCLKKVVVKLCGLAWRLVLLPVSVAAAQEPQVAPPPETTVNPKPSEDEKTSFQWSKALRQSGVFLGFQHAFRLMTEPGSRAELRGPFFKDYALSVQGYGGWKDGDSQFVNYVGHPMMGASSGWIYVHNDPRARRQQFGWDRDYWSSRLCAAVWSAAYSTNFELGPASEASIGNRGKERWNAGMVDLVITPTLGTGLLVLEDLLDRHVVLPIERRWPNRVVVALTRSWLNPNRSFANMLRLKKPYHRDTRRLRR